MTETRVTSETGGSKDRKLAQVGALDPRSILEVAEAAGHGTAKYGRLNYTKGYDWSLSFDALQRHLLAWWSGEDTDPESGLSHMAHAGWHCLALLHFARHHQQYDDRPKPREAERTYVSDAEVLDAITWPTGLEHTFPLTLKPGYVWDDFFAVDSDGVATHNID